MRTCRAPKATICIHACMPQTQRKRARSAPDPAVMISCNRETFPLGPDSLPPDIDSGNGQNSWGEKLCLKASPLYPLPPPPTSPPPSPSPTPYPLFLFLSSFSSFSGLSVILFFNLYFLKYSNKTVILFLFPALFLFVFLLFS
jgi:hypothetical protein